MKKALIERNIVVLLFIMVMVTFSFAQRDTKRLDQLYTTQKTRPDKLALVKKTPSPAAPLQQAAFQ